MLVSTVAVVRSVRILKDSASAPDPSFDRFFDGLAVLRRAGLVEGHVATSVGTFWSPNRPLSRQWWIWLVVVWTDGTKERSVEDYAPWTYVDDMKRDCFDWQECADDDRRIGLYDLEWLPVEEARRGWARLGITSEDF